MILLPGYTAVRWAGPSQAIRNVSWVAAIEKVYAHNPVTGVGFVGYTRGDAFPTLTDFFPGVDYLIDLDTTVTTDDAVAAQQGAFEAFPGYVPATTGTAPVTTPTGPGFIATGAIAAGNIVGGMLVARVDAGLLPYDATDLTHRYLLFGVALNSALPGGAVSVQRGGDITYPGLTLTPGSVLLAGPNGTMTTTTDGLAFSQVIGKAIDIDEFIYQVEDVTTLYPNT